jgi:predicted ATPase
VPSLGTGREATPPELGSVVNAVLAVLEHVATSGTTCWLVEDVQWGDPSSLAVLTYVTRVLRDVPVLLLITTRTGSTAAEPADADAVVAACGEVIELAPISAEATRALAEQVLGPSAETFVVEEIVRRADGVPLFIEELARSPRPGGRAPSSLSALITRELKAMSAPAVRLVELAALGEGHLEDALLRIAFDARDAEYEVALEELLRHGVLEVHGIGQSYQFRHALVREAAETMLPPGQRAAGHRAWAHALSVGVRRLEPTMVLAGAQHVFAGTEHPSALFDAALAASSAAVTLVRRGVSN